MRTNFSLAQLADPHVAEADAALRACVHCGICTASCPTYVLLGDERDSPRGRIVMMQKMLEEGGAPFAETVTHIDRCLSCLACRTVCPSGVDYQRLVDQSRAHIEKHYRRPFADRLTRWTIANVLTRPSLSRAALLIAQLFAPLAFLLPPGLRTMARRGARLRATTAQDQTLVAHNGRRVLLLPGCVQQVVAPEIDQALARVLARRGIALETLPGAGCCGALSFHLGREDEAKVLAKRNIEAFERSGSSEGVTISAIGCAAHLADYEHLFLDDPAWRARARAFASSLTSTTDLLSSPACGVSPRSGETEGGAGTHDALRVALHVPCSQQHGLRTGDDGDVLRGARFEVIAIPESHLCCGSAGSYSLLEPEIAGALRARKLTNIRSVQPDVIATSNIGCLQHLGGADAPPIVHVAELVDWAEGGPVPRALSALAQAQPSR